MPHPSRHVRSRRTAGAVAAAAILLAAPVAAVLVASAAASSFTLHVAKNVHVTNDPTKAFRVKAVNANEAVAVGPSGFAVYTFQGETTHHLICHKTTNANTNCWAFWPPVSPSSAKNLSKPSEIKGTLGSFHNHGTVQLTLNGQPLYYFTPDISSKNKRQALGDELKTFGSIWHIVLAHVSGAAAPSTASTMTTTTPTYSSGSTPGY
jgi:predicted lipoprotein with Yx(FWY)xxD motif